MEILLLLAGAFLLGVLAERLKQSPIIGYVLAGALIGPWVFDRPAVSNLSELGVALLLFSIGLEFSFSRLRRMGTIALGGGALQVIITLLAFGLGFFFFTSVGVSLTLGAMAALSSTAVVMRVLVDRAEVDSVRGRNALGILLLQDISVVPLVLMVTFIGQGGAGHEIIAAIIKCGLAAIGMVVLFYFLFNYIVPLILKSESVHASRDLIILLTILTAVGSAWLSHMLGLSPALGSFLAGMLLAESDFAGQFLSGIGSLRTLFVTLFFTSIGMLVNPRWMLYHLDWVAAGIAGMIISKTLIIYFIVRLFGNNRVQSLATGITLAQIGEFSFVLAVSAHGLNLISDDMFDWVVSVTILSIFLSPYLVAHATKISYWIMTKLASVSAGQLAEYKEADRTAVKRIFIIGFGPAGQKVADALMENDMAPAVIEMRPRTARIARKKGLTVHMGDAAVEDTLSHAGVSSACLVVVTIPDHRASRFIVETIRRIAPDATVIVRGRYHVHNREIEKAGAHLIIDEENLVGEELAKSVVGCLKGEGRDDISCACSLAGLPDSIQ